MSALEETGVPSAQSARGGERSALELRELTVAFPTRTGLAIAVNNVSLTVAVAVAEAAEAEGLAGVALDDIVQQVGDAMWQPEYRRIEAC